MIGQDHEARAENDHIEESLRFFLFQVKEVHLLDLHICVGLEKLLAGRDVVLVVINAQYPCLRKVPNNGREGSSGCSADIQHILDPFPSLISEPDLFVGRSG